MLDNEGVTWLLQILLVLHFVGLAAVIGAFLTQLRTPARVRMGWMVAGLLTQVVTGLAMMGVFDASFAGGANHVKLGVKLMVTVVALVLVLVARSWQRRSTSRVVVPLVHAAGALAIINVVIAVVWR